MSESIERQRELSKKVLIQNETKLSGQKTPSSVQIVPVQYIQAVSLGAILGCALFVLVWIFAGFSKIAIAAPFLGGISGIVVEMMRKKNKI
jgi:hypothetical protein